MSSSSDDEIVADVEAAILHGGWRVGAKVRVRVNAPSCFVRRGALGTFVKMHPPGDPNPVFHKVLFRDGVAMWISDQYLDPVK